MKIKDEIRERLEARDEIPWRTDLLFANLVFFSRAYREQKHACETKARITSRWLCFSLVSEFEVVVGHDIRFISTDWFGPLV